jgi:hypothetical protein
MEKPSQQHRTPAIESVTGHSDPPMVDELMQLIRRQLLRSLELASGTDQQVVARQSRF